MSVTQSRAWKGGHQVAADFPLDDIDTWLSDPEALVWFDLLDPEPDRLRALADELGIDPVAVESAVEPKERPKASQYSGHSFLVCYGVTLSDASETPELDVRRLSVFVLPRGLITVRRTPALDLAPIVDRWQADGLLHLGVGALVHALLDTIVDQYFETIQSLDDALERLEDALFDDAVDTRAVQRRAYRFRKTLVELRRIVLPMREVVTLIARHRSSEGRTWPVELDAYFDDLYDHVIRAAEWTESLRDMVSSLFESNLSLQDARLNTIMKKLAGWAAIIAVPTAVSGWFGQNIPYPGYGTVSGLIQSLVLTLGGALTLYIVFRKHDWI